MVTTKIVQIINSKTVYNCWANEKIATTASQLSEDLLSRNVISSFDSILKTIMHIWDAEFIWMERLKGNDFDSIPSKLFSSKSECLTFHHNSVKFHEFVMQNFKTDEAIEQPVFYKNLNGQEFNAPAFEIILHCMNHSTYHRGQLITLMRQAGLTQMPQTDYIAWLRIQNTIS